MHAGPPGVECGCQGSLETRTRGVLLLLWESQKTVPSVKCVVSVKPEYIVQFLTQVKEY